MIHPIVFIFVIILKIQVDCSFFMSGLAFENSVRYEENSNTNGEDEKTEYK